MFVCIVGTSRCGTTLLRQMMHEHPDLVVFRETHWLPKLVEFFGTQRVAPEALLSVVEKTTWDTGEDLLSVNLAFSPYKTKRDLLSALRSEFRTSGYVTVQAFSSILVRVLFDWDGLWGDKTPDYGFYMGTIQSLWPQCRFIHIVRDGLATARSMSRHRACRLMISAGYDNWCSLSYDGLFKKYRIASLPLESYVASWRRRLSRIRNESDRLSKGTCLEVRYEDLLQDSPTALSEICSFLDLPAQPDWLNSCAEMVCDKRAEPNWDQKLLFKLGAEELVALNENRSATTNTHMRFLPDMNREDLIVVAETAEQALLAGQGNSALELAVQMMTTRACHLDQALLSRAHDLAITASRQCGAKKIHRHWIHSANQYGLATSEMMEAKI